MYIDVFLWSFGVFGSPAWASFLVLSAPWHAGSPPEILTQLWARDEVRGTCSGGSKSLVCSARHSDHVESSMPM